MDSFQYLMLCKISQSLETDKFAFMIVITLTFHRRLDGSPARALVKFQIGTVIDTTILAASKFHGIKRPIGYENVSQNMVETKAQGNLQP